MYRYLIALLVCWSAQSHEFTPTYPKLYQSYVPGVLVVDMQLFNKRQDVDYYELSVLDKDLQSVPFAAATKILNISYLQKKKFSVYIRQQDKAKALYVCSKSKFTKVKGSAVSSKICSKIVK